MRCCNKNCNTPFCSECGERLKIPGLLGLLAHCRKNGKSFQNKVASLLENEKLITRSGATKTRWDSYISRCVEAQDKWQNWTDALEVLLKEKGIKE